MHRLHISPSELCSEKYGEINYFHDGKYTPSAAYESETEIKIRFLIPRALGTTNLTAFFFDESGEVSLKSIVAHWNGLYLDFDTYTISIKKRTLPKGLYFYKVTLDTPLGKIYAKRSYSRISFSEKDADFFQLSVSEFSSEQHKDLLGGVIYHVFVDRFSKDENIKVKDGALIPEDWSVIPEYPKYPGAFLRNNTFYGGTLNSAAKRLRFIKSLGTSIIYLSPIFESPSNHKYDTADYMSVDSMLGGDEALEAFVKKAKKLGMGVILDGVFNHTGADSVYFNRFGTYSTLGAFQSKHSPYFGWYNFKNHPEDYESWWGIEILPRINTGNKDFEAFILNSVIPKYRKMGVTGLRLDVADELSDEFISKIKSALSKNGKNILYGEVWEDASNKIAYEKRKKYYLGDELDGVMNYPLRKGLIEYLRFGCSDSLNYALTDIIYNAPKRIRDMQMNILSTHDTERILTALSAPLPKGKSNSELAVYKMSAEERDQAEGLLICAYTVLATLPGIPSIFYGDEVGLEGYSDPFNRMPYPNKISKKLLNHYKKIGQIRRVNDVYRDGEYRLIELNDQLLIFARYDKEEIFITVCNNSEFEISIAFQDEATDLLNKNRAASHTLPKKTAKIFKTNSDTLSIN